MFYTIATDEKRVVVATDGRLFGRSCLSTEDEGEFNLKLGIGIAIMNCYLNLPDKPTIPLVGYPVYYLVFIGPAYMLEMASLAMLQIQKHRRPLIAEAWGKALQFEIISKAPKLSCLEEDKQRIEDWKLEFGDDRKTIL
jgi:hypothetical protein